MKCPHCQVQFHDGPISVEINDEEHSLFFEKWRIEHQRCPSCKKLVLYLIQYRTEKFLDDDDEEVECYNDKLKLLVYPKTSTRTPCPHEVPKEFADDYNEACIVLELSPKASAALSRRCLQNLLRQVASVKPQDLYGEIQEVINSGKLPSHLTESIDAVRNLGNFAAHPLKSQKTGEIFDVEPHEAEWNLEVLEDLFDFYFVQPEIIKKRRDALNKKLTEAGKNPML
jgi:hypothetical protein